MRKANGCAGRRDAVISAKLSAFLIILIGLIAYSNSLSNKFVWDDVSSVQFNKHITSPSHIPEIFKSEFHHFGRGQGNFYRPFLTLSFMVDYALWQPKTSGYRATKALVTNKAASGFHLTNMLMHIGVALLVFVLVKTMFGKMTVALVTSLLFVTHPIQTQAVTYVSGRADMLMNLFLLSSFLLYWRASAGRENDSSERRSQEIVCAAGAVLCYVAALLSKETAIILPFLVLACTLVFRERRNRAALIVLAGLFISMLVYAVLRETCLKFGISATAPPPLGRRLLLACQAFATYIRLLFVPVGLHMERGIDKVSPLAVIFTVLCLAGACVYVRKKWRERPATAFALLWFLIAWLPISGIYPLNAPIAEHWLYLPSIGFIAFVVAWLEEIMTSERGPLSPGQARALSVGCLAIILLCLTALTIRRNGDWRDNVTLFTRTLEEAPNSSRVHYNLAVEYERRGEVEKALKEFLETLRLDPRNAYVRLDLAAIYADKRQMGEAARSYMEAISLKPNDPEIVEAYVNLARIYHGWGKREEAQRLLRKAMEVNPEVMRKWLPQLQPR